jgi:hypothetical protein
LRPGRGVVEELISSTLPREGGNGGNGGNGERQKIITEQRRKRRNGGMNIVPISALRFFR